MNNNHMNKDYSRMKWLSSDKIWHIHSLLFLFYFERVLLQRLLFSRKTNAVTKSKCPTRHFLIGWPMPVALQWLKLSCTRRRPSVQFEQCSRKMILNIFKITSLITERSNFLAASRSLSTLLSVGGGVNGRGFLRYGKMYGSRGR